MIRPAFTRHASLVVPLVVLVMTSFSVVQCQTAQAPASLFANDHAPRPLTMSHEEQVVRTAYAKLSYAAQIGMLFHAVEQHDGWPGLNDGLALSKAMNEQIRFELSDFKVGNLNEIGSLPWSSLMEGPIDVIVVHGGEASIGFTKGASTHNFYITYADAAWKAPPSKREDEQDSKVPNVKEMLQSLRRPNQGGEWTHYASYSVVAMLRERSVSYRAVFLFSWNQGNEEVLTLDYALAMGIGTFVNTPMYPSALVDTVLREIPFVQAWIVSNEISGCKSFPKPEVCCDLANGRCGIASEDLQRSLKTALDPDLRWVIATRLPKSENK